MATSSTADDMVHQSTESWIKAVAALDSVITSIMDGSSDIGPNSFEPFRQACAHVDDNILRSVVPKWFFETLSNSWQALVAPKFQASLGKIASDSMLTSAELGSKLRVLLSELLNRYERTVSACELFDRELEQQNGVVVMKSKFIAEFVSILFVEGDLLDLFRSQMHRFLFLDFRKRRLKAKRHDDAQAEGSDSDDESMGHTAATTGYEIDRADAEYVARVGQLINRLNWVGLMEELFTDILYRETEHAVTALCRGQYEEPLLDKACMWLHTVATPWLNVFLHGLDKLTNDGSDHTTVENGDSEHFEQWKARLEFHVYETFCALRMTELFDIVTDFPESSPSLVDLRSCLTRTHQHRRLVVSLRSAFARRLLHPGANTGQILDMYISSIKALRILDDTGVLLEAISEPVKEYLRQRHDTVRCIVTSLTDGSNSDLFEEVGRGTDVRPIEQDYDNSDEEDEEDESWDPDPIESNPNKTSRSRLSNDILSMLVHIYGSKELFVNEYRSMLADKIFNSVDFDIDREVRNLELLKLRFGDSSMLNCEIMVKDMEDSKRLNTSIKTVVGSDWAGKGTDPQEANNSDSAAQTGDSSASTGANMAKPSAIPPCSPVIEGSQGVLLQDLDVTIISKQFWPKIHSDELVVHPIISQAMTRFAHEYSVRKKPRQLVWKPNLGSVQLELEFDDGQSRVFTVSPIHATIIMHFGDQERWEAHKLATHMGLDLDTLRKKVFLWVNQGVIIESREAGVQVYTCAKAVSGSNDVPFDQANEDEGDDRGGIGPGETEQEEEMQVYESYINGMLTNFDALPLDRIHNMLKMFVSAGEHKYEKSIEELGGFLERLVAQEKLESSGDVYRLKR